MLDKETEGRHAARAEQEANGEHPEPSCHAAVMALMHAVIPPGSVIMVAHSTAMVVRTVLGAADRSARG